MKINVRHVDHLLDLLVAKTKQSLDFKGFVAISEQIEGISEKYLYENLYLEKEKAKKNGQSVISVQSSRLDVIAQFLGNKNYRTFTEQLDKPIEKILLELVGTYYSYVRRSDGEGILFRSPVNITQKDGKVWLQLKGPKWNYNGVVELENGCLFILLRSDGGKIIHHVYKIGTREKPAVLQGIFSGVSTAFDPIGGRAILICVDEEFSKLKNAELKIADLKKSKSVTDRRLGEYFSSYDVNNLSINKIVAFTIDDLGKVK
jgi:hypothetical protein